MSFTVALVAASLAPTASAWNCEGQLVPPSGYLQESAFAADAAAAADQARQKLVERICQGTPCAELSARAALWMVGQGGGKHCAMAVVSSSLVDEWRESQSARGFATDLAAKLAPAFNAAKPGERAAVYVDAIEIAAPIPGADAWLRGQLQQALQSVPGAKVVEKGHKAARPVRATIVERTDAQRVLLDVSVTVAKADGELVTAAQSLPRAVLPVTPVTSEKPMELRVEARCERKSGAKFEAVASCADAQLTEGDRYSLEVRPSESAYLYVLAYNSHGQLQALFPDPGVNNKVEKLRVPEEGWLELDHVKDVTEHVVVVASRAPQPALEALRGADVPPRTGARDADALVATRGFVGEVRARGFKRPAGGSTAMAPGKLAATGPGVAAVELSLAHR